LALLFKKIPPMGPNGRATNLPLQKNFGQTIKERHVGVQTDRFNWFRTEPLNFGLFGSIFQFKFFVLVKFF
jgi:hypothetical protein